MQTVNARKVVPIQMLAKIPLPVVPILIVQKDMIKMRQELALRRLIVILSKKLLSVSLIKNDSSD